MALINQRDWKCRIIVRCKMIFILFPVYFIEFHKFIICQSLKDFLNII